MKFFQIVSYISLTTSIAIASGQESFFFSPVMIENAKQNIKQSQFSSIVKDGTILAAEKYVTISDDELYSAVFGASIPRSWMVWSDGHCPSCRESVVMYNWKVDPFKHPWKVQCPNCQKLFPTNDFEAYYKSGLNEQAVFVFELADKSLLYNVEHPDADDPLSQFGVDDGTGCTDGVNRWRFIGAYLIYGQWKAKVLDGINKLSDAYVLTGDIRYSHKAAILLDRVADLYPDFDYGKQGVVYENGGHGGYVSVWHDACEETRELAMAYDKIRSGICNDKELQIFLHAKAAKHKLPNSKRTNEMICSNIENGILKDVIKNVSKISSNYPRTDITLSIIHSILGGDQHDSESRKIIDQMIEKATLVDGVTGEKGLAGYAAGATHALAEFLALYSRRDSQFLSDVFARHPQLAKTWRFHVDTLCLDKYYPLIGDNLWFAAPAGGYRGVFFKVNPGLDPSLYTFFWQLYELTQDPAYVQALYQGNLNSNKKPDSTLAINRNDVIDASQPLGLEKLPRDIFGMDEKQFQDNVKKVIDEHGAEFKLDSVNKQEWNLAILRSGKNEHARAAWVKYDTAGSHGHLDGFNLGLYAFGLDLMPDFGYAPPNHGGWFSDKSNWYRMTASHNTVIINGKDQINNSTQFLSENHLFKALVRGDCSMWLTGEHCQVGCFDGSNFYDAQQYQRLVCLMDVDEDSFYLVDVFRVQGGADHAKFFGSHFGTVKTENLDLEADSPYGFGAQVRNFRTDNLVEPPYTLEWEIDDYYGINVPKRNIKLRYTGLTENVSVSLADCWVQPSHFNVNKTMWVPRLMERKRVFHEPPKPINDLATTFVATIEPYELEPSIQSIKRHRLYSADGSVLGDSNVALEIALSGNEKDIFILRDAAKEQMAKAVTIKGLGLETDSAFCHVRLDGSGSAENILMFGGTLVKMGGSTFEKHSDSPVLEIEFHDGQPMVKQGDAK